MGYAWNDPHLNCLFDQFVLAIQREMRSRGPCGLKNFGKHQAQRERYKKKRKAKYQAEKRKKQEREEFFDRRYKARKKEEVDSIMARLENQDQMNKII